MAEKSNTKLVVGVTVAMIATAAVTAVATLSVTSNTSASTDIVTMKGDTLTVSEFYDHLKTNSTVQNSLVEFTVQEVLNKKYGSKVSDKDVQKLYDEQTAALGSNVDSALASYGYTTKTFKETLRNRLVQQYAIEQAAKKGITDKVYQAAYDKYTPEVTAQIIKLDDKAKAEEVLQKAKAGEDFAQLAKDNSTDTQTKEKGGEVKFDSTATNYPSKVMEAAFKLNEGEIDGEVVEVVESSYSTNYYVIKLNKKTEKSKNWKDYKDTLRKWIIDQRKSDNSFIQSVIAKELTDANVKVKDQAFQSVFSQYMGTESSESSSSSASKSEEKSSSKASSTDKSSTEASSSAE